MNILEKHNHRKAKLSTVKIKIVYQFKNQNNFKPELVRMEKYHSFQAN